LDRQWDIKRSGVKKKKKGASIRIDLARKPLGDEIGNGIQDWKLSCTATNETYGPRSLAYSSDQPRESGISIRSV